MVAVVTTIVAVACSGSDTGGGEAGSDHGTETGRIRSAEDRYCDRNGRFGTGQELVDAGLLQALPRLHTVATVPGGQCAGSDPERSGFAMICTSNGGGCGDGGGLAKGGTFVTGVDSLPAEGTLNPAVNTQGGMQVAAGHLFSGLVEIDDKANPVPELAQSWKVLDGGRTYEFSLRDGVTFHDGAPLTAADVKFSYEAALLRYHARAQSSIAPALAEPCAPPSAPPSCPSIEATERAGDVPARVTFRFKSTYAPLLQQLTHTDGAIIPKHVFDGKPPPTAAQPWPPGQAPVGTGPFKFVSQNPSEIVFDRFDGYFRSPFPLFDRIVQRAIPDANTRSQEVQAGGVDWVGNVEGQQLPALRGSRAVRVNTGSQSAGGATNCILEVIFNLWARGDAATPLVPGTVANVRNGSASPHPVLGDPAVRRAFAAALERNVYVAQVQQNDGSRLADAPVHSAMEWAHTPTPLPRYDLDESKRLLDAAGWRAGNGDVRSKGGQRLELDMSGFGGAQTTLMNKIRQDVARVGIDVKPATVQAPQMSQLYRDRTFDSLIFSNCQATDPEVGVRRVYHSTAITGAPFTNGAGYRNDSVDGAFDQAATELDRSARGKAYATAQEQIGRDLPTLWLIETVSNRAYRADCNGLRPYTGHFAEFAGCTR